MSRSSTGTEEGESRRSTTPPGRRATLQDIAEVLGVSQATVSRALRDDSQISQRTRAAVRLVAAELEYVPNHAARSLVRSASLTLGVLIPDAVDQLHGLIVKGFQDIALARGYAAIVASAFRDPELEARAFQVFRSFQVDAVALYGTVSDPHATVAAVGSVPVVFIVPESSQRPSAHSEDGQLTVIGVETEKGIASLVNHVVATGRSRLSYVNGADVVSNRVRRDSVAASLESSGLEPRLREYPFSRTDADYLRVVSMIEREAPEALICYDDTIALTLIAYLRRSGIAVPGDVAVTGFDDIPYARISNPTLTTVGQPGEMMGQRAASMLIDSLVSGEPAESLDLPLSLMVRESTLRPGV